MPQGDQGQEALRLLQELRAGGVDIDAATHDCVISGLGKVICLSLHALAA